MVSRAIIRSFPAFFILATIIAADAEPSIKALPLEVALALRAHDDRSSFAFSPDGQWLAHTVETTDVLPTDSPYFSAAGTSLAEGRARTEAHLTNTRTSEDLRVSGSANASWAPTWSPDGKHVAYYSDEDGSAGLWIWDLARRQAVRFPGVTVRPFFGFEQPRWTDDSRTLLCKVLPQGMTIAQANALTPSPQKERRFPPQKNGEPNVVVFHSAPSQVTPASTDVPAFNNRSLADLALLDVPTGRVDRIVQAAKLLWYRFSPDQRKVAYTKIDGYVPNTQQALYQIDLFDRDTGHSRVLASKMSMSYAIELNWSPDSRNLALSALNAQGAAALSILPVDGGPVRQFPPIPFARISLDIAPLWSVDGRSIYAIAEEGSLWKVDSSSGSSKSIATFPGMRIMALVSQSDRTTAWTTDNGRSIWALGLHQDGHPSMLRIDATTGIADVKPMPNLKIAPPPNIDANDASGGIAFVGSNQQHPGDLWIYDTKLGEARQIGHLNPALEHYQLGDAKIIDFRAADGTVLHATLLLPPRSQAGQLLPMVVWVYGGEKGSEAIRRFGLLGDMPVFDMHILATRGYAVLFPDAPLTLGKPSKSLMDTVMPAVDAAVAQSYADPDRLAVMGQSYGAYSVLSIIGQTNRFKAAVISAAGINPDLLASYLEMNPDGSATFTGYFEDGQGLMGGSPWQFRDRYLENSPIYNFDKIRTPLLMAQGSEDGGLSGSDATFVGLRRLGKQVEYRIYKGEGHVIQNEPNVRDFWERRIDFLGKYLGVPTGASRP